MNKLEFENCYICKCIKIRHCKKSNYIDIPSNHYHDTYELYYLVSGEQYFFIKDRTYHIKSGDLVFINIRDLHKITPASYPAHESIIVNFGQQFFDYFMEEILSIHMPTPFRDHTKAIRLEADNQIYIREIFLKMLEECRSKKHGYMLYIKVLMIELLIFLIRSLQSTPQSNFEPPGCLYDKISGIIQYINENYMKSITLTSLSQKFNISPYYLSRAFKEVSGFSYTEYLNTIRTKKAQELLTKTHLNITQIAEQLGYNNINQFGRIFKSVTGVTPSEFRKTENF